MSRELPIRVVHSTHVSCESEWLNLQYLHGWRLLSVVPSGTPGWFRYVFERIPTRELERLRELYEDQLRAWGEGYIRFKDRRPNRSDDG